MCKLSWETRESHYKTGTQREKVRLFRTKLQKKVMNMKKNQSESRHTNIEVNIIITHVNVSGHIKIALHSDPCLLVWYHAGNFSSKHSTQGKKERERERAA